MDSDPASHLRLWPCRKHYLGHFLLHMSLSVGRIPRIQTEELTSLGETQPNYLQKGE